MGPSQVSWAFGRSGRVRLSPWAELPNVLEMPYQTKGRPPEVDLERCPSKLLPLKAPKSPKNFREN